MRQSGFRLGRRLLPSDASTRPHHPWPSWLSRGGVAPLAQSHAGEARLPRLWLPAIPHPDRPAIPERIDFIGELVGKADARTARWPPSFPAQRATRATLRALGCTRRQRAVAPTMAHCAKAGGGGRPRMKRGGRGRPSRFPSCGGRDRREMAYGALQIRLNPASSRGPQSRHYPARAVPDLELTRPRTGCVPSGSNAMKNTICSCIMP
jgi:hypothetical protein